MGRILTAVLLGAVALGAAVPVYAAAPGEAEVKMEDAGAQPRRTLRYAFDPGVQWARMATRVQQSMEVNGNAMPMPQSPSSAHVIRATSEPAAGGETAVSVVMAPASGAEGGLSDEDVERLLGTGEATRIEGTIDDRGRWASLEVDSSASVPPEMAGMLDAQRNSLQQAVVPLPEGPIGVGGSWSVMQEMSVNGMTMKQTTVLTVTAMDGDIVEVDVERTMTFGAQEVKSAMLGNGMAMQLEGGEGSASGDEVIDLRKVLVVRGAVEGMYAMRMKAEMGALGAQRIVTTVTSSTTVEPWEPSGG